MEEELRQETGEGEKHRHYVSLWQDVEDNAGTYFSYITFCTDDGLYYLNEIFYGDGKDSETKEETRVMPLSEMTGLKNWWMAEYYDWHLVWARNVILNNLDYYGPDAILPPENYEELRKSAGLYDEPEKKPTLLERLRRLLGKSSG